MPKLFNQHPTKLLARAYPAHKRGGGGNENKSLYSKRASSLKNNK